MPSRFATVAPRVTPRGQAHSCSTAEHLLQISASVVSHGMRTLALALVALIGCRSRDRALEPAPGSAAVGSDPTFAMLRAGDTTVRASPEQTLATLRANCDTATADNHLAVACFSLGQLYDTGTFVTKDSALAMGMHDKACRLGEMRACAELGVFYDDGAVVPRDVARAKH